MATQVLEKPLANEKKQARKSKPASVSKQMQQSKPPKQKKPASTHAATTAQMNVRIDRALQEEGNAAFASIGVNPSEAVRALWEKAAKRGEDLEAVRKLLFTEDVNAKSREERLRLVEEGQQIFRNGMAQLGIDVDKLSIDTRTYEELRDEMYTEMLQEMGY